MASPQLENGYCSFATEIIDQFCKYRLSGEEWLVLWAIFRKTYCWHKKEDRIALSTFAVMTGLRRQTVLRALLKLSSKKIIVINKKDDRTPNLYAFNKHFDTWLSLTKKITLYPKKITPVPKKDNFLYPKKGHSIDTISKDTYSKDSIGRFTPPTYDEVKNYCDERTNLVDVQRFVDFYASKGWMVGKNKMKDWRAAVRTWEKSSAPAITTEDNFIKQLREQNNYGQ